MASEMYEVQHLRIMRAVQLWEVMKQPFSQKKKTERPTPGLYIHLRLLGSISTFGCWALYPPSAAGALSE